MTLLPRIYMQRCTHDTGPVLVHGNMRDEIDDDTALMWIGILVEGLQNKRKPRGLPDGPGASPG